jgi:tetratricopeptide (TPR) repeat protein
LNEVSGHTELLKNAVRQPIAALTAVELDSVAHAHDLHSLLQEELGERPSQSLSLSATPGAETGLLDEARKAVSNWRADEGVLFLIDKGHKDDDELHPFWRGMNILRESWASLNCHVIFFLLPHNYQMLIRVADHLADWMPLKLHITYGPDVSRHQSRSMTQDAVFSGSGLSPKVARQRLETLEKQLAAALRSGTAPATLVRRYYLPMFEAAIELSELHRAESLRQKVCKSDIPASDLPQWCFLNFDLDRQLYALSSAANWAEKLGKWAKQTGDEEWEGAAFHALGVIAQEQRDFEAAEKWYNKSLFLKEKQGNEQGAANTYHNLGAVAQEQGHSEAAEKCYRKSLEIFEKQGNEHGTASIWHNLGTIAQEQGNSEAAEKCYRKSLEIFEKQGNEHGAASTCNNLGTIAQEQENFEAAERWYRKSLEIFEKQGNEHLSGSAWHNLGTIAQEQGDSEAAEKWYRKSLSVSEKQGDEHFAAITYSLLGILSRSQNHLEASGRWFIKSIAGFSRTHDSYFRNQVEDHFLETYRQASTPEQEKLRALWNNRGLGAFPDVSKGS